MYRMRDEDFKKLMEFNRQCLSFGQKFKEEEGIVSSRILERMDALFGFQYSLMIPWPNPGLSNSPTIHGINISFVQQIYMCLPAIDKYSHKKNFIFSRSKKFKEKDFCKNTLCQNHFKDMTIHYIFKNNTDEPLGCLMVFHRNRINDSDIELLDYIIELVSALYPVSLSFWNEYGRNILLTKAFDLIPIGIMIVENMNTVTFVNTQGKEYLNQLGISNPSLYGTFYQNNLYPYYQAAILKYTDIKPIRYDHFIFNLVPASNPGIEFFLNQSEDTGQKEWMDGTRLFQNIAIYVYIINDNFKYTKFSESTITYFGISDRECQVIDLISEGYSNQQIADELKIKYNTVRIHISNIFRKTNVASRTELLNLLYSYEKKTNRTNI